MFPFHTWLPDAHTQAPTVGLGDPGRRPAEARHLRLHPHRHPDPARRGATSWAPWIGLLAVIGIIYGALCCLAQTDMKRLIAFSSVAHMGFVMLGIATLTTFGINAAVFGMVAHGLITGMLFFLAGSVKERYHTLEIRPIGGLLQAGARTWAGSSASVRWPRSACPASPGSGASSRPSWRRTAPPPGCPSGVFRTYMVIAAIGTVLAAGYLLWLYQRTAFGDAEGRVRATSHIARRHDPRVDRVDAAARSGSSRSASIPNIIFGITDDAVQRHAPRHSEADRCTSSRRPAAPGNSRTIDYHALAPVIVLAARSSCCCSSTCSSTSVRSGRRPRSRASGCWRRSCRCSRSPWTAKTGRCSAARSWSTTSRSW